MTDEQKDELKRILCIFGSGCAEAGPASIRHRSNPADCEECLNAVVGVIERQVFNKPKRDTTMRRAMSIFKSLWTHRLVIFEWKGDGTGRGWVWAWERR